MCGQMVWRCEFSLKGWWYSSTQFQLFCAGCGGAHNWACCCNCEHVQGCCLFHSHHQEWRACFQCPGVKVLAWGSVPHAGLSVTDANHWWLCTSCRDWTQFQYDWYDYLLNSKFLTLTNVESLLVQHSKWQILIVSGFMGAMISNLAFVFRNIFSKKGMKGMSVSGMNYYACLSIMSLLILTPFAIAVEGPRVWAAGWQSAMSQIGPNFVWWVHLQSSIEGVVFEVFNCWVL